MSSKLCQFKKFCCLKHDVRTETFVSTSPDGKTQNKFDYISAVRMWHSSILDVGRFSGADCDTDHCLVVAKVRERLAVSKQVAQKFDGERFNFGTINKLEFREQYQIEITNRFATLGNLSDNEDINRA